MSTLHPAPAGRSTAEARPSPESPLAPEARHYLEQVHRGLMCLERVQRNEIMAELTDSLRERALEAGGEGKDYQATAVAMGEPASRVVRRYRDLYGYSKPWTVGAVLITALLALTSRPELVLNERSGLFILATMAYLLFTTYYSLNGGWRTGLACGATAGLLRLVALVRMLGTDSARELETGLFVASYLLVSLAGVLLGYLPGKLKLDYLERYGWLD